MRQPPIERLIDRLDSKYGLVVATAKRARELTDGGRPAIEADPELEKSVSIALEEIAEGKLGIERPKGGIK
jgi:DNA-directed RNA polymerase subunit omega